jgi:AraC-like DNA-binding protein
MSRKRQDEKFDPVGIPGALITTFHKEYSDGFVYPEHYHDCDQLVFASQGVITVETAQGMWILPPSRALWIPSEVPHMVRMSGTVSLRTIYLKPGLVRGLPRLCTVIHVSPLLKELILYICQFENLNNRSQSRRHIIGMLLNLLHSSEVLPLELPRPADPRAEKVAAHFASNPRSSLPIDEICRRAGASKRTIERLFRIDVQMTLGRWRQQLRLLHSVRLLAEGMKIAGVAVEIGYSSPSAFISMFRKLMGATPGQYLERTQASAPR